MDWFDFFRKKLLLYRTIASNKWINGDKMQRFQRSLTSLSQHFLLQIHRREWKGGGNLYSSLPFLPAQFFYSVMICSVASEITTSYY